MTTDLEGAVKALRSLPVAEQAKAIEALFVALCDKIDAQETALASITRERDEARLDAKAYREVAVQEGWSFAMERAYARADYQRQREEHVDMRADVVRRATALVNGEGGE